MSRFTLLPAAARTTTLWKNGGGQTTEVAVFPPDAKLDDFDWRINMASVADAGRFSDFAGIDRVLAVIEGDLRLVFDGEPKAIQLCAADEPLSFEGDVGVVGTPVDGRVVDLNLMTRRGRWTGSVEHVPSPKGKSVELNAGQAVILFVGEGQVRSLQETIEMRPLDAINFEAGESASVGLHTDHDAYVLRVKPLHRVSRGWFQTGASRSVATSGE